MFSTIPVTPSLTTAWAAARPPLPASGKNAISSDVIVAERMQSGKIIYYDAQSGNFININEYEELEKIEVLKVDRLIFDVEILKDISRPV